MNTCRNITFTLLASLGLLSACGAATTNSSSETAAPTARGGTYVLTVGQSVALASGETLKLDRINDSRCKVGAVCVWEGYVSYSLTLTNKDGAAALVLSDSMPGGSPTVSRANLVLTLVGAEPATPPALHGPEPDYKVTLKVSQP
ncbi:hypothetical protein [Janthinobacterium agaricidamnosum]|uniref:Putative lipoprotein n=1 Tax=Janthinobacterium agaricidamnosum NBRC 102515 = DSM 9628 TaxID=1349767 RepID=W0V8G7_9BURK|nr:hypothetical protein [Janthinobacterium agaricidamnosum]CDG85114.1 putative lipoprotein [Janthinobacterium agaricidamnosum NBRC 102515 = DSM 9628]